MKTNEDLRTLVGGLAIVDVYKSFRSFSGFAYGRAHHFKERLPLSAYEKSFGMGGLAAPDGEATFLEAIRSVESSLLGLRRLLRGEWNSTAANIFEGHLKLIQDRVLLERVVARIRRGEAIAAALIGVVRETMGLLEASESLRIREKTQDLEDLALRVLEQLKGQVEATSLLRKRIVIGSVLYPSDIVALASKGARGLVIVGEELSSHCAILAQSMGIPVFMTNEKVFLSLKEDTPLFMNPISKTIHVEPSSAFLQQLRRRRRLQTKTTSIGASAPSKKASPFVLMANINLMKDFDLALQVEAEGVGLYRSEFAFMLENRMPSEDEQAAMYKRLFGPMKGRPITIRTFDLGGDKPLKPHPKEGGGQNMDFREKPLSSHHKTLLGVQLRAILRAGAGHPLHILFPMVSSLEVFRTYKALLDRAVEELSEGKVPFNQSPLIGSMVELPSIVPFMEGLSKRVDFLSIGTNDLTEHALKPLRRERSKKGGSASIPHEPIVLALLERIVSSARRSRTPISICGDMAENEVYVPFLVGIGLKSFSMNPKALPKIRGLLESIDLGGAKKHAQQLLSQTSVDGIESILGFSPKTTSAGTHPPP